MPFDAINTYSGGYQRAQLLDKCRSYWTTQNAAAFLQEYGYQVRDVVHLTADGENLQCWVWLGLDCSFILFDGAMTIEQAEGFWRGCSGGQREQTRGRAGYNAWASRQATRSMVASLTAFLSVIEQVECIGYSAGGVAAQWAFRALGEVQRYTRDIFVTTFGSPKSIGEAYNVGLNQRNLQRWMNDEDPVPFVPPGGSRWRVPYLFANPAEIANYNALTQYREGVVMYPDGTAFLQMYPTTPPDGEVSAVARWLEQATRGQVNGHTFGTYLTRLMALGAEQNRGAVYTRDGAAGTGGGWDGDGEVRQEQQRLASQIANAAANDYHPSPVYPAARVYRAKRKGGIWYVYLGEQIIASGITSRTARAIARSGNYHIRRLMSSHHVDVSTYQESFASLLEEASTPNGQFIPVLNTDLFG